MSTAPLWRSPVDGTTRQAHKRPKARVGGILIGWEPVDAVASALVGEFVPADAVPLGDLLTQVASGSTFPVVPADPEMVPVPAASASKATWVEFVLATEDISREEIEGLTKAQIVERFGA